MFAFAMRRSRTVVFSSASGSGNGKEISGVITDSGKERTDVFGRGVSIVDAPLFDSAS